MVKCASSKAVRQDLNVSGTGSYIMTRCLFANFARTEHKQPTTTASKLDFEKIPLASSAVNATERGSLSENHHTPVKSDEEHRIQNEQSRTTSHLVLEQHNSGTLLKNVPHNDIGVNSTFDYQVHQSVGSHSRCIRKCLSFYSR